MISDQSCPLCGEKMNLFKGTVICSNKKCGLRDVISIDSLKDMESQIARIKQEAKQELMNEFDAEFEVMENEATDEENYCIVTYAYDRIKKKHGVE